MRKLDKKEMKNKLRDIESINFGTSLPEIISSLEILLLLFTNDDPEIAEACRLKIEEGFGLLKSWGEENQEACS